MHGKSLRKVDERTSMHGKSLRSLRKVDERTSMHGKSLRGR